MSYDIRLAVKTEFGGFVVIDEPDYSNPTYNLSDLFRACTGWDYKQGEYYRCSEVQPNIINGLKELICNPGLYEKYLPDNGWGTMKDARDCLESILVCITENVEDRSRIPIEYLYIKW